MGVLAATGVISCYFILRELSARNGGAISARIDSVVGQYGLAGH